MACLAYPSFLPNNSCVSSTTKDFPTIPYTLELVNPTTIQFLSSTQDWNADNLRMQSILNNYALNVGDRVALYRKVRAEGDREGGFLWRLIRFAVGRDDTAGMQAGLVQAGRGMRSRRETIKGKVVKKEKEKEQNAEEVLFAAEGEGMGMTDLQHPASDPSTTTHTKPYTTLSTDDLSDISSPPPTPPLHAHSLSPAPSTLGTLLLAAELSTTPTQHPYHLSPQFASGSITPTTFTHSLLAQSYFRPYILDVIRALSTCVMHIAVPAEVVGRKYGDLVAWCLERGLVPMGLYRVGSEGRYVWTNCHGEARVKEEDLVYVVGSG